MSPVVERVVASLSRVVARGQCVVVLSDTCTVSRQNAFSQASSLEYHRPTLATISGANSSDTDTAVDQQY